ncbi:MAG: sugar ABC transporter substrate-binding protein [Ignavibacteriae bacterium]|nr:MAG: sugar ABC transporter substrate-binding protein [Ignavibacteriota bacterium]
MKKSIVLYLAVLFLLSGFCVNVFPKDKLKIAVIPKSNASLFWKSVHMGAKLGAMNAADVEILWKAPQSASNQDQQIELVEECIAEGVSGIILAPINDVALGAPVAKAMKKKTPVLIFDSALKGKAGKNFIGFVGIDNKKAGKLAGEHLATLMTGKGNVVLLRYVKGQANTTEREEGFLESLAHHESIRVIVKDVYAGGTTDEAKKASLNILNQLKEADGIFCPNEVSTMGMLLALRQAHLAGKVKFIGFDTPAPVVEALKNGEVSALIAQDPSRMGYLSVKTIVDYIRGKKISDMIDIGVSVITRENINDANNQKLLSLPSVLE